MINAYNQIRKELLKLKNEEKARVLSRFFKTAKGEYGEEDQFLGIVMGEQRILAKKYAALIKISEIQKLLQGKFHEERMTALLLLLAKYKKGDESEKKKIFDFYLKNAKFINNWDLVDVTCRDIVGHYLMKRQKDILYRLAKSKNIWERRIAIVSTFYFISQNKLAETFKIAKMLLSDEHDLIHKAVGWMLRETGKRDEAKLHTFLSANLKWMPRTTLRYAIERFAPDIRLKYMLK